MWMKWMRRKQGMGKKMASEGGVSGMRRLTYQLKEKCML
jgi:hypothetical protein